jgi:hypothetical protein
MVDQSARRCRAAAVFDDFRLDVGVKADTRF